MLGQNGARSVKTTKKWNSIMKHVRRFELFENERALIDEQKGFLNRKTHGRWKFDPSTGKVNV